MEQDESNLVVIGNDGETLFDGLHIIEIDHVYLTIDEQEIDGWNGLLHKYNRELEDAL